MEARTITSSVLTRRCIVMRLNELTLDKYRMLVEQNAGALLVLLPQHSANMTADLKEVDCLFFMIFEHPVSAFDLM